MGLFYFYTFVFFLSSMPVIARILLFLPAFLASILSFSQSDTLSPSKKDTIHLRFFNASTFLCEGNYLNRDTTLYGFQRYWIRNSTGNPGSAVVPLRAMVDESYEGFRYWANPFEDYLFTKENATFYTTKSPYTNLTLVSGATKEEQIFKGVHTQNINKNWNFAGGFQRYRSDGDFLRQRNTHTSAFLNSNYSSGKGNYFLLAHLFYNNLNAQENGGIEDEGLFEEVGFQDKKYVPVRLTAAQRRIWTKGVYLKQFFGHSSGDPDSTVKEKAKGFFTHTFHIEDNRTRYRDENPDLTYYPNLFRDSLLTVDSTYFSTIENEVAWQFNNKTGLCQPNARIGIKHQLARVKQYEIDSVINNFIVNGEVSGRLMSATWDMAGSYCVAGANAGDIFSEVKLVLPLKYASNTFTLRGGYSLIEPAFLFNRFLSNHFDWSYQWNKSQTTFAGVSFKNKRYRLEAGSSITRYNNLLYFDVAARPKQFNGSVDVATAFVKKDFFLGKWVITNNVLYQYIPDKSILRLPELITQSSIYYENALFKKALQMEIGAELIYTTEFLGNSYMPATGQFYHQNQILIGNYPYIDLFINFKIKTVRAFIKYEHVDAGFLGNRYYYSPLYPTDDGSFAIGISWDFFN